MATVVIGLADVATVRPSSLPIVGEGAARTIRLRHFPGAPFGPPLSMTLGETEVARLRRFQLISVAMFLGTLVAVGLLGWHVVVDVVSLLSLKPRPSQVSWPAGLVPLVAVLAGAEWIRRNRPAYLPIRVPGRPEVRLEHLDRRGAEDWVRVNPGLLTVAPMPEANGVADHGDHAV